MTERWASIKGFEGYYEISDHGRLKALERTVRLGDNTRHIPERVKSVNPLRTGYVRYDLSREGKKTMCLAHRLVATHFIPNPDSLPQVNHKDGVKSNNNYLNLEWCDGFHNHQHAVATGLQKAARGVNAGLAFKGPILVFDGEVHIDTLCGAAEMRAKGYNPAAVYKVTLGYHKVHRGKRFIRQLKS